MNISKTADVGADEYDILVIGSGAAGMLSAIRAHDLGLRSVVVEKAHQYGGTSALSGGGIWIPCHHLGQPTNDSPAAALAFLQAATQGAVCDV
jgi:3-oxosteroid 1-dehydrogenase